MTDYLTLTNGVNVGEMYRAVSDIKSQQLPATCDKFH
jgi:hypothetical protein